MERFDQRIEYFIEIENLNDEEKSLFKQFWLRLFDKINEKSSSDQSIDYRDELFYMIGEDHPDIILLRYLRARKWNVEDALEQIVQTLEWRSKWNIQHFLRHGESMIEQEELLSGKTIYLGYDHINRPINYVSVRNHLKGQYPTESTERLTVLVMEIGRKLLHPPVETVTVIFDLTDFSLRNMDYQHVKFIINLLQYYYPESLGLALIVNAPWIFNSCWILIKSWLDPVVQQKIRFVRNLNDLNEFIDRNLLPKHLNGSKLDHFRYLPPTNEELINLQRIRKDHQRESQTKEIHSKMIDQFIDTTQRWIRNQCTDEQRDSTIQQLNHSFQQRIPYLHTQTHYHRIGLIQEPIFDLTFQQIQMKK